MKKKAVEVHPVLLLWFCPHGAFAQPLLLRWELTAAQELPSRAGLYGPSAAFLLHPPHKLCLCSRQALAAASLWAGGFPEMSDIPNQQLLLSS